MGKLGRDRVFFAIPTGTGRLRIPTDLAGLTTGHFDPSRGDKNHRAALAPFCNELSEEIRRLGRKVPAKVQPTAKQKGDLRILEAPYDAQGQVVDIAAILNAAIVDNKLHIQIGNHLATDLVPNGDPCVNVPKKATVRYRYGNRDLTEIVGETGYLDLP